ncbi:MAG TPA: VOC family protein [Chitinophagales bacterium]|nr:VOC family protein [Chitinophagales bacterium]
MAKQIFINLPVKDLNKTVDFFTKLGFTFNPQFTDENATCMIVGENIFVMLLVEKFYKTFIPNHEIADARKTSQVLIAFDVETRADVDALVDKALKAGGTKHRGADDHGWMYSKSFADLDGHIWEVLFADESLLNGQNAAEISKQATV